MVLVACMLWLHAGHRLTWKAVREILQCDDTQPSVLPPPLDNLLLSDRDGVRAPVSHADVLNTYLSLSANFMLALAAVRHQTHSVLLHAVNVYVQTVVKLEMDPCDARHPELTALETLFTYRTVNAHGQQARFSSLVQVIDAADPHLLVEAWAKCVDQLPHHAHIAAHLARYLKYRKRLDQALAVVESVVVARQHMDWDVAVGVVYGGILGALAVRDIDMDKAVACFAVLSKSRRFPGGTMNTHAYVEEAKVRFRLLRHFTGDSGIVPVDAPHPVTNFLSELRDLIEQVKKLICCTNGDRHGIARAVDVIHTLEVDLCKLLLCGRRLTIVALNQARRGGDSDFSLLACADLLRATPQGVLGWDMLSYAALDAITKAYDERIKFCPDLGLPLYSTDFSNRLDSLLALAHHPEAQKTAIHLGMAEATAAAWSRYLPDDRSALLWELALATTRAALAHSQTGRIEAAIVHNVATKTSALLIVSGPAAGFTDMTITDGGHLAALAKCAEADNTGRRVFNGTLLPRTPLSEISRAPVQVLLGKSEPSMRVPIMNSTAPVPAGDQVSFTIVITSAGLQAVTD